MLFHPEDLIVDGILRNALFQDLIDRLDMSQQAQVETRDALDAVRYFSADGIFFDIIFMDPPYEKDLGQKALCLIAESKLTHEQTLIFFESRKNEPLPKTIGSFKIIREKTYGDSKITLYAHAAQSE